MKKAIVLLFVLGLLLSACAWSVDGGGVVVSPAPVYVYTNPYPYYDFWFGPYYGPYYRGYYGWGGYYGHGYYHGGHYGHGYHH